MNQKTLEKLEFHRVQEQLISFTMSFLGKRHVEQLHPGTNLKQIERLQHEAEEALAIVAAGSSIPIPTMEGMDQLLGRLSKQLGLAETDMTAMSRFLRSITQLKRFMARKTDLAPTVTSYAYGLNELMELQEELERCIPNGWVVDEASYTLEKTRKQIRVLEERLRKKLDALLHKYQQQLQETIIMERGGQPVLAVKRDSKRAVPGTVVDQSASGQTVFIVPAEVTPIQQELDTYRVMESAEVALVLDGLTGMIVMQRAAIEANVELIGHYDFLFAKARYARAIGGRSVRVNDRRRITVLGGRHPLLGGKSVPLDFSIGDKYHVLIITGPNTGGKTVSLKTVGLLTVMVQSGLLVPVEADSEFAVFDEVLVDIGDGQSIDQSLSTFSSHVRNVIGILEKATAKTLILMDELATGTDPGEGIGLSIAVLEELANRRATVVATTHFNEIKQFAEAAPGFENARMLFNLETLEPLYRLKIGEAGNSYAFEIAQKLGMPAAIIARSREITHTGSGDRKSVHPAVVPKVKASIRDRQAPSGKPEAADAHESSAKPLQIGDRVWIHSMKRSGIVYALPDERGQLVVLVKKQKVSINHKRVSPYLSREQLYPDANTYDLDIVLESKDVRRKRNLMKKQHVEGLTIEDSGETTH